MKVFLSGIISGSRPDKGTYDQSYRQQLREILRAHLPQADILCPWDLHPDAAEYGPERARLALVEEIEAAAGADLIVAYLPEASMGTAIEMWEARRRGIPVFAITPLRHNWVVLVLADRVFASIADFAEFAAGGGLTDRP